MRIQATRSPALRLRRLTLGVLALALGLSFGCVTAPLESEQDLLRRAESRRDLGVDHLIHGRTPMAIRDLMQAESMNPEDYETHLWLGEAYRRRGMLDEAESHLVRSVELSEGKQRPRINLSALYIQMERYADAAKHCELLINDPTYPTPWQALTNRGWAEFKQGNPVAARASWRRALDFYPRYWPAILNTGILDASEAKHMEALEQYQEVLGLAPGEGVESEVNYRMGESFVALGHRQRALRHFANAVEQAPYGRWGQESKRYLKMLR